MKARMLSSALALTAISASGLAHANPSVNVTVTGTIKPAIVCTPTVSTSEIAYGDIKADTLSKDSASVLAAKPLTLSVACTDAAKFSVKFTDAQKSSVATGSDFFTDVGQSLAGADAKNAFGLGSYADGGNTRNIGALFVKVDPAKDITSDGSKKALLSSADSGASWTDASTESLLTESSLGKIYGFANTGETVPAALKNLAMNLNVIAAIDSKGMEVKNDIDLDGKFTIEVTQL